MTQPLIGLTCHMLPESIGRSAVSKTYVDAIAHVGGAPIAIPLGLDHVLLRRIFNTLDGVLLPGGEDVAPELYGHPRHSRLGSVDGARDDLEITVARWALEDDLPVLGICRGMQVLAVAAGGTLYQDLSSDWDSGTAHDVREFGRDHLCHSITVVPETQLCSAIGCDVSWVNSFHHQAVRDIPSDFIVSARSDDGIIEGIEAPARRFALGVQCHPEALWNSSATEYRGLFAAFVDAASVGRAVRVG